ncbi:hypothetical protein LAZ67_18001017 [Cordylochernes scorpioides]|uniref:CCHC-type domain-containing protein n=1 Tax=Cordylochernes scorpioides TaxID=51811 RepID=A0ABY6LK84_9ARAC|nr:hypothetical protein LAZ67_18001017 [Cordylochernes scorpioides]
MKKSQKIRTLLRSSAAKSIKEIDTELDKESPSRETIRIHFKVLEFNENQLRDVNVQIMNLMLEDETIIPHGLEKEQDMVVQYGKNFIKTELRVAEYLQLKENEHQGRSILDPTRSAQEGMLSYKLPKMALTVYDGTCLEWLRWWSQFKTIHESPVLSEVEKFQYLVQSMRAGLGMRSALAGYSEDEVELSISIDQRLQRLLEFLRREVKGEQRLEYMREGFAESSQRKNYGQHVARTHIAQIKDAQVTKRMYEMRKFNACFRCLRVGHMRATCRTQIRCSHCRGPHHTPLHLPRQVSMGNRDHGETERRNTEEPQASTGEQEVALSGMHVRTVIPKALLATARVNAQLYGINDTRGEHVKQMVSCSVESLTESGWTIPIRALVVGRMTGILPSRDLRIPVPSSWKALPLADPQFETSGRVDVILGADVYGSLLLPDFKYDEKTQLCAQKTRLDWIISGKLPSEGEGSRHMVYNIRVNYEENLNNILRRLWEVEEVPIRPAKSGADEFCEELYKTKVKRTASGRYIVPLPFDPKRKLRVVFDASTVTSNGFSFNIRLYTGSKFQRDIFAILMNWRHHKVVILADIEKMYRQVLVCPTDAARQKILWRETSNEPRIPYRLNTVTYGTSPAPFLVLRTLIQMAIYEGSHYPIPNKKQSVTELIRR